MFKPLLAEAVNLPTLKYPTLVSPKYDGFRCVINTLRTPMSRNLKPILNAYVFAKLSELELPTFDGELLTFTGDKVDDFNTVQSKLTSRSGRPEFRYMIFDNWGEPSRTYMFRNTGIQLWFEINQNRLKYLEHVKQKMVHNEEELLDAEAEALKDGWEGLMVRSAEGLYKFGRSTTKEGILLKLKRFFDAEATIKEAYEFKHNANEATTDNLGHTVRSSHQANMQGMDMLGGWTVEWRRAGEPKAVEFDLGVGFTQDQRVMYWKGDRSVGRVVKFKYQSIGPNGKPRFPVFLGFRDHADMDASIPF